MKRSIIKNIFAIIACLAIIVGLLFLFLHVALPPLRLDTDSLVAEERVYHDDKLDCIIQDFSTVLSFENVKTTIWNKEINVVIYGEYCNLNATLDEDMKVTKLNEVEVISEKIELYTLLTVVISGAWLALTCVIAYNVTCIIKILKHNKFVRNEAKKQKSDVKVEVLI